MDFTRTIRQPAPYSVVALVTPPATADWLDLIALHARLLPLAQAAGHGQLVLRGEIGYPGGTAYEAYGTGGVVDMQVYVLAGTPSSRSACFAAALEAGLQAKADRLFTAAQR